MIVTSSCVATLDALEETVSRRLGMEIRRRIHAPRTLARKIDALALAVLVTERKKMHYGQRTPSAKLARSIGVSPEAFGGKVWINARSAAYEVTHQWIGLAERQLGEVFGEIGVL